MEWHNVAQRSAQLTRTVRRRLTYVRSQVQGLQLAPSLAGGGVVQISHGREQQSGAQRAPRQQQSEQHTGEANCEGQRSARAVRARVEERAREARRRGGEGDRAGRDDEGLRLVENGTRDTPARKQRKRWPDSPGLLACARCPAAKWRVSSSNMLGQSPTPASSSSSIPRRNAGA